jgi:hypothetical protein
MPDTPESAPNAASESEPTTASESASVAVLSAHEFLVRVNWPVLPSEQPAEFEYLLNALEDEIRPRGFIEHMYVSEVAVFVWEILRLRRYKTIEFGDNPNPYSMKRFNGVRETPELLDHALVTFERRRDRAIACIAQYRERFAAKVKRAVDRIIDVEPVQVPLQQDSPSDTSPA